MDSKLDGAEMNGSGLWIDETNADAWGKACQREIALWLGKLAGSSDIAGKLLVEVAPPFRKAAKRAFDSNTTLDGEVRFRRDDESIALKLPMPYHGAFLYRREKSQHPLVMVWPTWLAEAPGFRILKRTSEAEKDDGHRLEWRIGLPGGKWIGAPLLALNKLKAAEKKRLAKKSLTYFGDPGLYPDWLREPLGLVGPRGIGQKIETPASAWQSIHGLILDRQAQRILPAATDEENLDERIAMTFPVWLKHRITRGCIEAVLALRDKRWRKTAREILQGEAEGSPEMAEQARSAIWASLKSLGTQIAWAIHDHRSEEKADFIDPINALDLVSRITRLRRVHRPASKLKEMPASYRQNHPSFRGRICPVETPESEQVGLTLQLAAGATVDFAGTIHRAESPAEELGYGAGLIPFYAHNDGARNMMSAKNLRQAVPVVKAERPKVRTGREDAVANFARPLLEIGVCPATGSENADFCVGRDLLVAYLPWHGMNFEDAIVLGHQVLENGALDSVAFRKAVRLPIKVGWVPAKPAKKEDFPGLQNGLASEGCRLIAGDAIAVFAWEGKQRSKQRIIRYQERTPAFIKKIQFLRKSEWTGGVLEYELEYPISIRPGDKLMGRHGNKGVVGAILREEQMPRLPSDGMPEHLRGRRIDVLLNPHGVISRMNIGQLIETHLGWLLHSGVCREEDLRRRGCQLPLATPFSEALDHDKVQELLTRTGLDRYGRIRLDLPDGGRTLSPVIVGFQHLVRLRHVPELKSQARRGGNDALYAARTGQAIHGRKFGGGQRLGEMEVWALAGHQAEAILGEMLGVKSSADLVSKPAESKRADLQSGYTGYSRVLRDWLFALTIDLQVTADDVKMSFLDAESVINRVGRDRQVTSSGGLESHVAASFRCSQGKKHPCEFELLEGEKIMFRSSKTRSGATLSLDDFLAHLHLRPDGPLRKNGAAFHLPLCDYFTGQNAGRLELTFTPAGQQWTAVARFESAVSAQARASEAQLASLEKEMAQAEWEKPKQLPEIHLYGQFAKTPGVNWAPEELLQEFQKKSGKRAVGEMRIVCPKHTTAPVKAVQPFGEAFRSASGGLFDPRIFGSSQSLNYSSGSQWGYIELPVEVQYPLHVFLTESRKPKDQQRAVTKFLIEHGIGSSAITSLTRIPVLPTRYRLPTRSNGKLIRDNIERRGYSPLLDACNRYSRATEEKKEPYAKQVARQVEWLFLRLANELKDKTGLIRHDGLGRRVDRSARLVITPNPQLDWDKAGIPATVLLELMGDLVADWLEKRSEDDAEAKPLPALPHWSWMRPRENAQAIEDALKILEGYFEAHPEFVVLLNRQPSLHRDSFQAFHPVPLPPVSGDVIQLCPLTCKGFAADFDGDEMVVHLPMGPEAQAEARRLRPSQNLYSLAFEAAGAENVLAHFDQDFVMGTFWLGTSDEVELRECFLATLAGDCCRDIASTWNHPDKRHGTQLLAHIVETHTEVAADVIASWMRVAFRACSLAGTSFGFYEVREIADKIRNEVGKICDEQSALIPSERPTENQSEPDYNKPLEKISAEALGKVLGEYDKQGANTPGLHFAAMALSGARGKKQVRQIIAARGMLDPGAVGFDPNDVGRRNFFFRRSLVDGLAPNEAFWAAMNARSSMCDKKLGTGHAGGLTRSLVFALWPFRIVSEDCGSKDEDRNPITCRAKNGFCARCYGPLPGGKLPALGFPAGLIAAQSIGERGTQLSMRSFHAGESAVDIHTVRSIFGVESQSISPEFRFRKRAEAPKFLERMKGADAYEHIRATHFQIVWKVLNLTDVEAGGQKNLPAAIRGQDPITRLAHRDPTSLVAMMALTRGACTRHGPFTRLFLGGAQRVGVGSTGTENGNQHE